MQLSARLENARAESARALVKTGAASGAICGALAVLTLVASTAPRVIVVGFWAALWLLFTLWIGLPWRRLMRGQIPILESALRAGRARVIRIQSPRVVEFQEEEDEGIAELLGESGMPVDSLIVPHGQRLTPERIIPAAVKCRLELPDHLAVVATPLDHVESALGATADR